MKRGWVILIAVLMVFGGCRPRGVLSSKQMQEVLYDLHRTDAILQCWGMDYGHDEAVAKYYEVTLEKHGVTQAQFDSSLVWYTDHPSRFDKIYPKLRARVEKEKELYELAVQEDKDKQNRTERDLPPIEEVMQRNLHGLPSELWKEEKVEIEVPFKAEKD